MRTRRGSPQLTYSAASVNRRPHLTLVALIAAGLIGVGLLAIPGSPIEQTPTLGLDLQGGLEVTLKAVPPPNRPLQKTDLDRSVEILRNRVDRLGVAEPEIRKQGKDQIVIDLPGLKNHEQVIEILGKTAQLELFDLEANLVPPSLSAQGFPIAKDSLYSLLAGQQALVGREHQDDVVPVRRQAEAAQRTRRLQGKAAAEQGGRGGGCERHAPEGVEDLRRAAEDGRPFNAASARSSAPASTRSTRPRIPSISPASTPRTPTRRRWCPR